MHKLIDKFRRNRLVADKNALIGLLLVGPLFKLITLLVIVFLIMWILSNLMNIAFAIILIAIAIFLIVGSVTMAKKYLFEKKEAKKDVAQ